MFSHHGFSEVTTPTGKQVGGQVNQFTIVFSQEGELVRVLLGGKQMFLLSICHPQFEFVTRTLRGVWLSFYYKFIRCGSSQLCNLPPLGEGFWHCQSQQINSIYPSKIELNCCVLFLKIVFIEWYSNWVFIRLKVSFCECIPRSVEEGYRVIQSVIL